MAVLTVTAASVAPISGPSGYAIAGAVITQGQAISIDPSDGKAYLCDTDSATAARRVCSGISLNGAAAIGQPVTYAAPGATYNPGATVTVGGVYVGSTTAGGINPVADLASGNYTNVIGIGVTAASMLLICQTAGVPVP